MKVKDAMDRVKFDEVVPLLGRDIAGSRLCLNVYRSAFDILRCIRAEENCGVVKMAGNSDAAALPVVEAVETGEDPWRRVLGKDLIVVGNVNFSDESVAAGLLRELTMYGIDNAERQRFGENLTLCHFLSDCIPIFAFTKQK